MKMRSIILTFLLCSLGVLHAKPLDSLRVETEKGVKYILHKVDKNEALAAIVKRYKANTSEVIRLNGLKNGTVSRGQVLKIPYTPPRDTARAALADTSRINEAHANAQGQEVQKASFHTVLPGETLNSIAKKYKLTTAQIVKWNSLKLNKVVPNQVLIVDENAALKPYVRLNGSESQMPQPAQPPVFAAGDLIEQEGLAVVDETMQVAHADAPVGTIIKVINLDNNAQCLVKVTHRLDAEKYRNIIITIGSEAWQKLNAGDATVRVKLVYLLKP